MIGWTHINFIKVTKVERFCLTLVRKARLRYEFLTPISIDWQGLQNQFRQEYSKIGNRRGQLFHAWQSFHFDENTESLDAYVTCIRHVSTLLGYGDLPILEVYKNILPAKLYWVLFPIDDLRQAVETARRILTKEKIDKQLLWQSSSTQFMSIKDSYNKRDTFDTQDGLEDKIDRLTVMMEKLTTRDNGTNRQFKPQIYQSKTRGQSRHFLWYMWYYMILWYYRRGNFRGNMRMFQSFGRQSRWGYRGIYRNEYCNRKRGWSRSRERSFSGHINDRRNDRRISNSRLRLGLRLSTNRDKIRYYKHREYDHFAKDSPTSEEERESKFNKCLI